MIHEYPYKSYYFQLPGNKLHYLDEGHGPVIVMLHGNPTWSYYYRSLVKTLSENFRVIVPDHMGCGFSDKPQDYEYTLENHISNLTNLLTHLNVKSVSLVVHDWGGAIGLGYATRNLEKVKKLVVLNTAAFRSTRIPFRIKLCRLPLIGKLIVQGLNGFAWPATFMAVRKRMNGAVSKAYLLPYDSWMNRIAIFSFVRDIPLEKEHVSYNTLKGIEKRLIDLKNKPVPMMVCWGGHDFCFNDYFLNEWKSRFPDATYHYFKQAGHYILEDMSGVIEPIIEDFFRSNEELKDNNGS